MISLAIYAQGEQPGEVLNVLHEKQTVNACLPVASLLSQITTLRPDFPVILVRVQPLVTDI